MQHDIVVLIPSIKPFSVIMDTVVTINKLSDSMVNTSVCCSLNSASINRNECLKNSTSEYIVMIDDDITGFYRGWETDMIKPLLEDSSIVMSSARLVTADGTLAFMLGEEYNVSNQYSYMPKRKLPTACVSFRRSDLGNIRFDEGFLGSGFEDDDFCMQLGKKHPNSKFVINNSCRLIHINEMKNQKGSNWDHNKAHFIKKWGSW